MTQPTDPTPTFHVPAPTDLDPAPSGIPGQYVPRTWSPTPAYRADQPPVVQPVPTGPAPGRRRHTGLIVAVTVSAVLVLAAFAAVGMYGYAQYRERTAQPTEETLHSACETGVRDEYNRRVAGVDSEYVAAALSSITVGQAHQASPGHWTIEASFTATAVSVLGSMPATVLVSCQVTTSGSKVVTVSVVNR